MLPLLTPKLPLVPDRRQGDSAKAIFEGIERATERRRSNRDRRGAPRVAVMLNLEIENSQGDAADGLRVVYRTHDLSGFGVAIRSGPAPETGSLVKLRIFVTDDSPEPIEVQGEVLGSFDENGGVRVKFLNAADEQLARLQKFLTPLK